MRKNWTRIEANAITVEKRMKKKKMVEWDEFSCIKLTKNIRISGYPDIFRHPDIRNFQNIRIYPDIRRTSLLYMIYVTGYGYICMLMVK